MAVDQDKCEALLSSRFVAEQDPADVIRASTVTGGWPICPNASFLSLSSEFSSPAESEQASSSSGTGEDEDDDDYIAELTHRMAQYMLQDEEKHENTWSLSGSPQSTLWSPLGSDQESPTGPSREPSPPLGIENFERTKKTDEERAVNKPTTSVPITIGNSNATFQSKQALIDYQIRASQYYRLKQEKAIKQVGEEQTGDQYQSKVREFVKVNKCQKVASGNNLHALHQKQRNQQSAGSDLRAVFLNAPGSKNNSCGTGVFLPRGVGTSQEPRNKQGCSTVLIPARVVQALKLHFEKMGVPSRLDGSFPPQHDAFGSGRHNRNFGTYSQQKRQVRTAPATKRQEISLPHEWTY